MYLNKNNPKDVLNNLPILLSDCEEMWQNDNDLTLGQNVAYRQKYSGYKHFQIVNVESYTHGPIYINLNKDICQRKLVTYTLSNIKKDGMFGMLERFVHAEDLKVYRKATDLELAKYRLDRTINKEEI